MKLRALMVQDEQGIHMNKKGISPLIATILLIAFVILLAILIWFWWNKVVKEQTIKLGEQSTAEWICANEVEFSASGATLDGMKISFEAENIGERAIDYFKVRADTSSGSSVVNTNVGLNAGSLSTFEVEFADSVTGTSVEIIPAIRVNNKDSFCTDKALTAYIEPV